ncbi:MAG: hypothetical protein HY235_27390 [Acidobacteria bacterium]|nr:hypothetical protein [Acidobacteriota bacterium]
MCRRAIREEGSRLVKLVILTDEQHRFDLDFSSHVPFKAWAKRCKRFATEPLRLAEMVMLNGDAVLRIRDGLETRRIVLAGEDPLRHRVSDSAFEILDLNISRAILPFRVFARSRDTLSVPVTEELYKRLQKALPTSAIYVVARNDPWFFSHGALYATCWWESREPADEESITSAPEVTCAQYRGGEPACVATAF